MSLALTMVVKNERENLDACLQPINGLFDEFVAIDTGSTDDTACLLAERFGARVVRAPPTNGDAHSITEARNRGLAETRADWTLVLDADERISAEDVQTLRRATQNGADAYFVPWRNRRNGSTFDDYKLALFRNGLGIAYEGWVHPNPQPSLRRQGLSAELLNGVAIHHSLDNHTEFRRQRKARLEKYISENPTWWRYQWFLGYTCYMDQEWDKAVPLLRDTCNSLSKDFPVECLNAHIVLTDLNARKQIHDKCYRIMRQAASFYDEVKDDFEVKANHQLAGWIRDVQEMIDRQELDKIHAYEFAY